MLQPTTRSASGRVGFAAMANRSITLTDDLIGYVHRYGVREHPVLADLRERTAPLPEHNMQIGPDQGAFMALLVRLMGATRILEIGTFTGYSSTAMALALPPDGRITCCDVSAEWTDIARRAWADAGVEEKVDLRLAPATKTLAELEDDSFDLAFIDADKPNYDAYYEGCLRVVRPGGLILIDNVLWSGEVADPSVDSENVRAIRALNEKIAADERVDHVLLPIADGLTMARRRD
jgi:predicted O-methyltransferase YrrM